VDFELKFREASIFEFQLNLVEFLLGIFKLGWNLDKRLVFAPSDQLNSWERVW
jgi:hypothetical protein